jgi:hypothetical protein
MQNDTERTLMGLERAFWEAMKQRNGEVARDLTDETCLLVGAQGIGEVDKEKIAGMVTEAPYRLDAFDHGKVHVRMLGRDVALVAYEVKEKLTVDGTTTALDAYDASVWVRRGANWLCAMHTESLAGDPFGRDRVAKSTAVQ